VSILYVIKSSIVFRKRIRRYINYWHDEYLSTLKNVWVRKGDRQNEWLAVIGPGQHERRLESLNSNNSPHILESACLKKNKRLDSVSI
jgi:hypothetical protein